MDGTLTISGATLLAGGNQRMTQIDKQASNSQIYISSKTSYTANQVVYILNDDTTIREIKIPKIFNIFIILLQMLILLINFQTLLFISI